MSSVSFGSKYHVYFVSSDIENNNPGHKILQKYCEDKGIPTSEITLKRPKYAFKLGEDEKLYKTTIVDAAQEYDHKIDMICNNYQLKHTKITPKGKRLKIWSEQEKFWSNFRNCFGRIF